MLNWRMYEKRCVGCEHVMQTKWQNSPNIFKRLILIFLIFFYCCCCNRRSYRSTNWDKMATRERHLHKSSKNICPNTIRLIELQISATVREGQREREGERF